MKNDANDAVLGTGLEPVEGEKRKQGENLEKRGMRGGAQTQLLSEVNS